MWDGLTAEARDAMYGAAAGRLPVGRAGEPADVAAAVLFLADNPYTTGSTVYVDGGGTIA
ncbi:SDR family oxidoreductase [Streptomyces sp. HUAS TT3]|uniref:SDR family oxidoreductase n=1 Tax=Streptomyces sp. HUAS TT3 TaxID=3447510 RepID=UPI003F658EFF